MIEGIGVKNFRSFDKPIFIDLKPITVFVGKNSSGKSSLLRTFPLFRQSVEENTTGPVLWYGRYVDFGDFSDVISKNTNEDSIEFSFKVQLQEQHSTMARARSYFRIFPDEIINTEVKLRITSGKDKKTKTKEVIVKLEDVEYSVVIDESTNAKVVLKYKNKLSEVDGLIVKNLGQFIPIVSAKTKDDQIVSSHRYKNNFFWHSGGREDPFETPLYDAAVKALVPFFHYNTSQEKIREGIRVIGPATGDGLIPLLKIIFREQRFFIKNLDYHSEEILNQIYPLVVLWNVNTIGAMLNFALSETYRSVKYIAPLRATSERFYRFQDLQVNEIDHTGSNLAMLLNSLKTNEKIRFEQWTKDNFGFFVKVKQVGAHFAVTIQTEGNDNEFNVSDMGFGYSQVLPIIAAIWIETENRYTGRVRPPITFIIEQPELHLHPAYQNNLARVFAKVIAKAKKEKINIRIIFETHSQNMVEALGECVEDSSIDIAKEDISILIFNKDSKNQTNIDKASFNEGGYLTNWPVGFFSGRDW
ncbi:AAA family ATPase [Serratia marcescens]|uniref:AAA family ATPase n=1 Tax=Serratia marcescens TaxID=615 RepID=UPI003FA7A09C